jgi:insertion element IS1 protein InsB
LIERLNRWGVRLYCADAWAAYAELIPPGRLYVGKDQTHGIERDHARQRHWLAVDRAAINPSPQHRRLQSHPHG